MRPWRMLVVAAITIAGLVIAVPHTWNHLTRRSAAAQILEIFATPTGDGRMTIALAYEFQASGRDGSWVQQASAIGGPDGPEPVLVLPEPEALDYVKRVKRTPKGVVFYSANDPEGTAFIMPRGDHASRRYIVGLVLVVVALLMCLPTPTAWRTRRRTT